MNVRARARGAEHHVTETRAWVQRSCPLAWYATKNLMLVSKALAGNRLKNNLFDVETAHKC